MANFTYLDTQVNKAVGDVAPNEYFGRVLNQCNGGDLMIGNIVSMDEFNSNLRENALPENIINMTVADYDEFLQVRRNKMTALIEEYYKKL